MFNEPKRKHYGLVIGVAVAVLFGLFRGTKMTANSESDFIALVIAFLIILLVCAGIGYAIDHTLHRRNKATFHKQSSKEFEDSYNKAS